ncbi:MAG TPA: glyceraldehyde-3-phosphate dehydrogenase, partial [Cryomorphaceae bacterium]|nr:glyceraldehyde-3-phosphate dehydrogenase [Cryomorphaceae bacterium]
MAEVLDYQGSVTQRIAMEKAAAEFIKKISELYLDKGIEMVLFRNQLIDQRASEILNLHEYARKFVGQNITIDDTLTLLNELVQMDLAPARMDIGRLASEWLKEKEAYANVRSFLEDKLNTFIGPDNMQRTTPKDVVLYGFGRIGRLLARVMVEKAGGGNLLRLRAIVVRGRGDVAKDLEKRASLLRRDSVHGPFDGTIAVDADARTLTINGNVVQVIYADSPSEIDYTTYDIHNAVIVDNTGIWRDEAGLGQHLECKGAAKALLTAPGKGDIKNIVFGINHETIGDNDRIVSAASCTTNAIVPVLKVLNDEYGVATGHVETVHSYTNDQNLI